MANDRWREEMLLSYAINNSNKRFSRTVGSGTWSGQTSGIPIRDKSNRNIIIGYKRSLRYKSDNEKDQSEKWLLKEYFLPDECIKKSKNKDIFVICRIKEKKKEEEENNNDVKDEDVDGLVDPLFEGCILVYFLVYRIDVFEFDVKGGKDDNPPNLKTIFFETRKKDNKLVEPKAIEKHAQLEKI
ncbi:hypothetical protein H5410_021135, partial [Solanum commersonii]